jgi:DNA-directed RNA polymerase specialized sigma24 family protein
VQLRDAIAEDHDALLRSVAVLVARTEHGLRWPQVLEMATEILHEAVREALEQAHAFDPARSATAWVRGIAARLLLSRRRADAHARRCVPAAVLGEDVWAMVLGQLCTGASDGVVAGRLDLEQALERISPQERRAIVCRYYQGLEGEDLAKALGVPSPGAARVRVCRALQALRSQFPVDEEEVHP